MVEMVYFTKLDDDRYVVKFECNSNDLPKMFDLVTQDVEPSAKHCYNYSGYYFPEKRDEFNKVYSNAEIILTNKTPSEYQHSANKQREERNG